MIGIDNFDDWGAEMMATHSRQAVSRAYDELAVLFAELGKEELSARLQAYRNGRSNSLTDAFPALVQTSLLAEISLPLTTAWICAIAAAELFDDIQDHEWNKNPWLTASQDVNSQGVNTGLFLLACAQIFLSRLSAPDVKTAQVQEQFGRVAALAAVAQMNVSVADTLEAYFEKTIANTGIVFGFGAWAAAYLVQSDTVAERFRQFGTGLGMWVQVRDDCRDGDKVPLTPSQLLSVAEQYRRQSFQALRDVNARLDILEICFQPVIRN